MKTLDWVCSLQAPEGGFLGWPEGPFYPEITGYLIPTLMQWGKIEEAKRAADWLEAVQLPDGSFKGVDGKPATFDTAACLEGLTASGRYEAAKRADTWLSRQDLFGAEYLCRVMGIRQFKTDFRPLRRGDLRTHYWAYALEGFYLLGEHDWVRGHLGELTRGIQPYYLNGTESDTCATAQVAKLRLLLGMDAGAEITALRGLVNSDGSLPHDLANKKKVAWAAKYYLDMEYILKNQDYDETWHKIREWEFQAYNIDIVNWDRPHPFGISGCFRVRNDHEFLEEAVMSHLPYLDEAVIALQPSDEKTEEVVRRLALNPKVRVERYPVAPVFITDPDWGNVPENSIRSFVYLSNWALSKCRFSWIARIEADVICLSSFSNIRERIEREPEAKRLYGRVILNVAGKEQDMVSVTNPRNGGWDECVFPNRSDYRFIRKPRYEVLNNPYDSECAGWSALHMKRCKSDKIGWNGEEYAPFTRESVAAVLRTFNSANPYPGQDNPEGADCLFER